MSTKAKVKLSSLRTDGELGRQGDWVESLLIPGVEFKVRSINYPPYTIARDIMRQRLSRKYGVKPIPQEVLYEELGRLYVDHLLLDWRGFADDNGKEQAYTKELGLSILTDPDYREVISAVELATGQIGQGEIEFVEEEAKNSEPPSATK
jgi:hypothetical protein